jgi:type I restriction enzyme S subunit
MTDLPRGWTSCQLEEVCDFNPKHPSDTDKSQLISFVPMPAVSEHSGEIEGASDRPLSEVWTGYTHFADGDVIFAKITPCMENGKAAVARSLTNGLACGSTEFHVLRSNGAITPDYIWRFIRQDGFRRDAEAHMTGAVGQRRVPKQYMERHEIPLPPLAEQRRIVRKLYTLSARSTTARTHLTAIEKLVERYKRAVLGQFFSDTLETNPLAQSCIKIGSGATPRGGKNVYLFEGTPLIRSQNVRFEGFDWEGLAYISDAHAAELRNVIVQPGDVLLNITGASIGRVCIAPEAMDGARVNQHVSIIRPQPETLDTRFVQYFLSSPAIQNWIWNENYGVTRQALTKGMIEEIAVPAVPLDEQREIVRRIEAAFKKIDRLTEEAAKALKLLGHLDQRILAKAFAGELVPQDPTEEPAEILLARIRAERETAPKTKRGKNEADA